MRLLHGGRLALLCAPKDTFRQRWYHFGVIPMGKGLDGFQREHRAKVLREDISVNVAVRVHLDTVTPLYNHQHLISPPLSSVP